MTINFDKIIAALIATLILGIGLFTALSPTNLRAKLSPIDEAAHIDYSIQLADGQFPRWGNLLLPTTRNLIDCEGNGIPPAPGNCSSSPPPAPSYAAGGISYESGNQPPLGYIPYAITWSMFHLQNSSPGNQLHYLRLSNLFWIFLSLLSFYFLLNYFKIKFLTSVSLALLIGNNQVIVNSFSYVTNDSCLLPLSLSGLVLYFIAKSKFENNRSTRCFEVFYMLFGSFIALSKVNLIVVPIVLLSSLLLFARNNSLQKLKILQTKQFIISVTTMVVFQIIENLISSQSGESVYRQLLIPFKSSSISLSSISNSLSNTYQILFSGQNSATQWFSCLIFGLILSATIIRNKISIQQNEISFFLSSTLIVAIFEMLIFLFFSFVVAGAVFVSPSRLLIPLIPLILLPLVDVLEASTIFNLTFASFGLLSLFSIYFVT